MKKLKILVCGLPGSGKSYLSERLKIILNATWLNADKVRGEANDWDFSVEGRIRQANRMKKLSADALNDNKHVIADFVCPTEKTRQDFGADYTIWMDTIKQGRFEDTNRIFVPPKKFEFKVTSLNAELWSEQIIKDLKKKSN